MNKRQELNLIIGQWESKFNLKLDVLEKSELIHEIISLYR